MRSVFHIGVTLAATITLASSSSSYAQLGNIAQTVESVECGGKFVNPLTDICWDCLLPLTLGSVEMFPSSLPDFGNPGSPICACTTPVPRIGISVGLWEPVRMAEATRKSWCFPNMGGLSIDPGIGFKDRGSAEGGAGGGDTSYHAHWYIYPAMYLFELVTDFLCLEQTSFDIGYVTELDPLWQDDSLSNIITPEAALFTSLPAIAACTADCALATRTNPSKTLFWCMGCHGPTYPANGNIAAEVSMPQGGLLSVERLVFKLHRALVAQQTSTSAALCLKNVQPTMDKRQYRWQMVNPRPHTKGPFICPRTGSPTPTYEGGKMFPVSGEDMGWLVWRKRNCCVL